MKRYVFVSFFLVFLCGSHGVDAASVKQTPAAQATSRCLTMDMKKLHAQTLAQAEQDAKIYGINASSTSNRLKLYQDYRGGLEVVWSAMEQPYCGYGSQGVKAVRKSYLKNVHRLRETFLQKMKVSKK